MTWQVRSFLRMQASDLKFFKALTWQQQRYRFFELQFAQLRFDANFPDISGADENAVLWFGDRGERCGR